MDLKKVKASLAQIQSLISHIEQRQQPSSTIEKDLLLDYVKQLYADILDIQQTQSVTQATVTPDPAPTPKSQPTFEIVEPPQPTVPNIIDIDIDEPTPPPPIVKTPTPRPSRPNQTKGIEQLFEYKKATELSEKLSSAPIDDLTKAMSINDRLLYMNELFGRDNDALNESLKLLNKYEKLEEAKGLIANLADQYQWLDEDRLDIAQSFIKLIRRKYQD